MLRWDRSGRALLVSDAPRRAKAYAALPESVAEVTLAGGLLYIDLPRAAYRSLLGLTFTAQGPWRDAWFAEQALAAGILARRPLPAGEPDIPLLRAALLACAQGETEVRAFCRSLRAADAAALRRKNTASARACAALVARWLHEAQGVGLPETAKMRGGMLG